eukprot:6196967-Pleurochrysis_carterae.AAC.2
MQSPFKGSVREGTTLHAAAWGLSLALSACAGRVAACSMHGEKQQSRAPGRRYGSTSGTCAWCHPVAGGAGSFDVAHWLPSRDTQSLDAERARHARVRVRERGRSSCARSYVWVSARDNDTDAAAVRWTSAESSHARAGTLLSRRGCRRVRHWLRTARTRVGDDHNGLSRC